MPYHHHHHLHQNITSFSHQQSHQPINPSTSLAFDPSYIDIARDQGMNHEPNYFSGSNNKMLEATKCDQDEYGFLLDLVASNAVPSSLEDMRLDDENGSVFI